MNPPSPEDALQRTRRERLGSSRGVPCAGSLGMGRWPDREAQRGHRTRDLPDKTGGREPSRP